MGWEQDEKDGSSELTKPHQSNHKITVLQLQVIAGTSAAPPPPPAAPNPAPGPRPPHETTQKRGASFLKGASSTPSPSLSYGPIGKIYKIKFGNSKR